MSTQQLEQDPLNRAVAYKHWRGLPHGTIQPASSLLQGGADALEAMARGDPERCAVFTAWGFEKPCPKGTCVHIVM